MEIWDQEEEEQEEALEEAFGLPQQTFLETVILQQMGQTVTKSAEPAVVEAEVELHSSLMIQQHTQELFQLMVEKGVRVQAMALQELSLPKTLTLAHISLLLIIAILQAT